MYGFTAFGKYVLWGSISGTHPTGVDITGVQLNRHSLIALGPPSDELFTIEISERLYALFISDGGSLL